jgi:hypothetical protein
MPTARIEHRRGLDRRRPAGEPALTDEFAKVRN